MDENLNVVDATQENVVDSQSQVQETNVEENQIETVNTESSNEEQQEVSEEVVESHAQQTQEDNARYAAIRRDAETKGMDRAIAAMGMEWNGAPIKTYQEYQAAMAEQKAYEEAERQGLDPAFYSKFKQMEDKLQGYEQEKVFSQQESMLQNDPIRGPLYGEWKDEIKEIASNYNTDLMTAYMLMLNERLPQILEKNKQQITNETITKLNENSTTTAGSLSDSGANDNKVSYKNMPQDEFEKIKKMVANGQYRR